MLNKFLGFLLFLIFTVIVAGTAIAIFKKDAKPGEGLERIIEERANPSLGKYGKDTQYNLIGKLWIPLKTEENKSRVTLIVSPWLEYSEDRTFYEEMDKKHKEIQKIISQYFKNMTMENIKTVGEEYIKKDLTEKINEILVLGKINKILFNDFQFLEE